MQRNAHLASLSLCALAQLLSTGCGPGAIDEGFDGETTDGGDDADSDLDAPWPECEGGREGVESEFQIDLGPWAEREDVQLDCVLEGFDVEDEVVLAMVCHDQNGIEGPIEITHTLLSLAPPVYFEGEALEVSHRHHDADEPDGVQRDISIHAADGTLRLAAVEGPALPASLLAELDVELDETACGEGDSPAHPFALRITLYVGELALTSMLFPGHTTSWSWNDEGTSATYGAAAERIDSGTCCDQSAYFDLIVQRVEDVE